MSSLSFFQIHNYSLHASSQLSFECQVHREYKKRLADVLAKPFDLAEYKELYNATKNHKLAQKARNLRSGSKSYNTNDFAPSYLDQFPGNSNASMFDISFCSKKHGSSENSDEGKL